MTERPQRLDPRETESKGAKAERIYKTLSSQAGHISVYSPGLIFVERENQVNIWKPEDDKQTTTMIERGLLHEDLTRGIVNIKIGSNASGPFKQIALTPNDELKPINIHHGLGNPGQRLLHRGDIQVMRNALTVAAIPLEIATEFGNYEGFLAELGTETDTKFLKASDQDPRTIDLYHDGLEYAVTKSLREGSDYHTTAKIAADFLTQLTKAEKAGKL